MHSYKSHSSDYSSDTDWYETRLELWYDDSDDRYSDDWHIDTYTHTHSSTYWDSRHTLTHTTATVRRRLIVHDQDWQDTVTDVTGTE